MGNHIFISYSHEDGDFAEILKGKLKVAQVEVWTDESRLVAGEDWREGIDQAIKDALALIVVMTPKARASEYVTYEWAFAWGIGVKVIPILLESTPLHPRLEALQYLNFTHRTMRPWDKLINLINNLPKIVKHQTVPNPQGVPSMIQNAIAMLNSTNIDDREVAMGILVESDHPAAFETLTWFLNHHPLGSMRQRVVEALEQIGDAAAVPSLIKALDDQQLDVRRGAIEALGQIGDKAAVPALTKALDDQDLDVRRVAAEALGQIGDEGAVSALIKALDNQDSSVRWAAAKVLGDIGDKTVVPTLIKVLDDQESFVRQVAVKALKRIGTPRVLKVLENYKG